MDTDPIFYQLFIDHPDWLRDFTGLTLPEGCKGSSQTLKQFEIRCDLLLIPESEIDPHYIFEFQLYHDHSIFNRIELTRNILWKQLNKKDDCRRKDYHPREVETVIIFGSKSELPNSSHRYPTIKVLFIDKLLEKLKARDPESPLLAALAPLLDEVSELEKNAARHYAHIIDGCPELTEDDRDLLHEIFLNLLFQRFKNKSRKEIRKMIAELTPLSETQVAKEFLEEGIEKGIEKGTANLVRVMAEKGKSHEEIAALTDLSLEQIASFLDSED